MRIRNILPQRAIDDRPYSIHGTLCHKLKFEEKRQKKTARNISGGPKL